MAATVHPRFLGQAGPDTTQQAVSAEAVTPSNTNELTYVTQALWVGGAGDVALILQNDSSAVTFTVAAGSLLPFHVKKVLSTGTNATNIVALY